MGCSVVLDLGMLYVVIVWGCSVVLDLDILICWGCGGCFVKVSFRKPIASRIMLTIVPGVSKGSTLLEIAVFLICGSQGRLCVAGNPHLR